MSVGAVGAVNTAPTNTSNTQLQRDQQRLLSDTRTKANAAQLAADQVAVARDRQATAKVTRAAGPTGATYL